MPEENERIQAIKLPEVDVPSPTWLQRWRSRQSVRKAEASAATGANKESWLNFHSFNFDRHIEEWDYTADHLDARVLESDRIEEYLTQRLQGESDDAYAERVRITSYTPDFFNAIVTLAGMVFANETGITRQWELEVSDDDGENKRTRTSLGNPQDPDNEFHRFWMDCDGDGTNYKAFLYTVITELIAFGELWIQLTGWSYDYDGNLIVPRIRILRPQNVLRECYYSDGTLCSAKVLSYVDTAGTDQFKEPLAEQMFTVYYADGYNQWRHDQRSKPQLIGDPMVPYNDVDDPRREFLYENRSGRKVPPLFRVKLPFKANVGYLMAKKANTLFNHESSLDMLLHIACFVRFASDVVRQDGEVDKELMLLISERFMQGSTVIPGSGGNYIAPPMAPAQTKSDILEVKRKGFYQAFFQAYGDRAVEKTATEMKQDWAMNVQAFLTMLAMVMEEFENELLYRLEQAWFPEEENLWGIASATWSKDYSGVVDPMENINMVISKIMPSGGAIPATVETITKVTLDWFEAVGYEIKEDEKRAELKKLIEDMLARQAQEQDLMRQFA